MALCIGVMGSDNQPLLIKISPSIQNPIDYHYMLYSALDIVEEKSQISQKTAGLNISGAEHRDLYLGLLYPSSDEVKIYAYCTNTKVKIILIVDATNTALKETDIRNTVKRLHLAYSNMIMNPFYEAGSPIEAKSFHNFVESIIAQ